MKAPASIHCERVYGNSSQVTGYRVLIDRLWPRGIRKDKLMLDEWCKELAPSTELRRWFDHQPPLWAGFYQKYHAELRAQSDAVDALIKNCAGQPLILLYSARDEAHNNAVALKMYLEDSD